MGKERVLLVCWLASVLMEMPHVAADYQSDALYTFRQRLEDPNNVLQSWDPTLATPCAWFHVTCNSANEVTRLDLGYAELEGPIVSALGSLRGLRNLELFNNSFSGTIPPALGNLENLRSLDLQHNHLSGEIPSSFGNLESLIILRLNDNRLSGPIPKALSSLPKLRELDLSGNKFVALPPRRVQAPSSDPSFGVS